MHDANHGSFSRHRWINRMLAYTSDALGASSWLWRIQHNTLHHGNTNVVGFDADIALAPWARLAPTQPWRPSVPLAARLHLAAVRVPRPQEPARQRLLSLIHRRDRRAAAPPPLRRPTSSLRVVLGKFGHLGWAVVIPLLFNPWWAVLAFYVACSWLVGFMLAIIFQLAHCVDVAECGETETPRRGDDFADHQLRTTVDIASPLPVVGHVFRWIAGGLDHQIEHHLAPGLPHTIYPKLAARFRLACDEHGIAYHLHTGIWPALCSHTRWLRTMGSPALIGTSHYGGTFHGS